MKSIIIILGLLTVLITGCTNTGIQIEDRFVGEITYYLEIYNTENVLIDQTSHTEHWETEVNEKCYPYKDIPKFKANKELIIPENATANFWIDFNPIIIPESPRPGENICFQKYYQSLKGYYKWRETLNESEANR